MVDMKLAVAIGIPRLNGLPDAVREEVVASKETPKVHRGEAAIAVVVVESEVLQRLLLAKALILGTTAPLELLKVDPTVTVCIEEAELVLQLDAKDHAVDLRVRELDKLPLIQAAIAVGIGGSEALLLVIAQVGRQCAGGCRPQLPQAHIAAAIAVQAPQGGGGFIPPLSAPEALRKILHLLCGEQGVVVGIGEATRALEALGSNAGVPRHLRVVNEDEPCAASSTDPSVALVGRVAMQPLIFQALDRIRHDACHPKIGPRACGGAP
mmetsp:Transcript_75240/g.161158  ORF Transcript_75240/g.161158 Transcript_75240/m.161158 type:complete len:267 (+) Transcript_75240:266-1066(+)